jgi:predicted transcriptional regulator
VAEILQDSPGWDMIGRDWKTRAVRTDRLGVALPRRDVARYDAKMTKPAPLTQDQETEAERQDRLVWEAEGIAEARAELDAGLYVDIADVRAWVDSLRTDTPLPLPPIRHS